ncbi:hypothetical protein AVEN_136853-1 [Araneus ventricosus]|uniref:Uncharacterized protein n=1 Tax=Araneus ventricosus TaxID=182803 RepID=A0A4Y2G1M5_ARAVE|nr:hypothetical protein AVEN_136853-1 [Araneus ventricosus]
MKAELRNDIKECEEKIAVLQDHVSSIGFRPIVNCAVHASNIARFNPKRPLSNSEEDLNIINDDSDLNSFKFPSKRLTAKIKIASDKQRKINFTDQNKFSNLENADVGESPDTPTPVKKPAPIMLKKLDGST